MRITVNFLPETLQATREWTKIFKIFKEKKSPTTYNYIPRKLILKSEGKIKLFSDNQN